MQGEDSTVLFSRRYSTYQEAFPKTGKSSLPKKKRKGKVVWFDKLQHLPSFSPSGHGDFWPPKILHVAKNEGLDHVAKSAAPAGCWWAWKVVGHGGPHHVVIDD